MLSVALNNIYIYPNWVAEEYLHRCKRGAWKKESTMEALKCFNLERTLEAEELGKDVPEDVDMSVYMGDVIVLDV
ncbi:hypothetical protein ACHAXN_005334 [Cyclotella atomus]|jgi:hypothetical protein